MNPVDGLPVVDRAWVWITMPEKKYFGYVEIERFEYGEYGYNIQMVDPIPNKIGDECYGERGAADSIDEAVNKFVDGMLTDRERRIGDRSWKPKRSELKRLWKSRKYRLKEIHAHILSTELYIHR